MNPKIWASSILSGSLLLISAGTLRNTPRRKRRSLIYRKHCFQWW